MLDEGKMLSTIRNILYVQIIEYMHLKKGIPIDKSHLIFKNYLILIEFN